MIISDSFSAQRVMIDNNQTNNKTKAKIVLSPISRETELFLVEAKCEGVWRTRTSTERRR